jgi:beta-glucanase (GH16 family)
VSTFVDGKLLRTWTAHADLLDLPETILFTIWASSAASWAGPLTSTSAPTGADVDWIKVYAWNWKRRDSRRLRTSHFVGACCSLRRPTSAGTVVSGRRSLFVSTWRRLDSC